MKLIYKIIAIATLAALTVYAMKNLTIRQKAEREKTIKSRGI